MSAPADIVTVTLNPAIDETVFFNEFIPGAVNRAVRHHRQPGGKGVNVSSLLAGYGVPSVATGFLGRENARLFDGLFRSGLIRDGFVRIDGETRTGIKIIDQAQRQTTDLNFAGAAPSIEDMDVLEQKILSLMGSRSWVVIGGRQPAGVSIDRYKLLLDAIQRSGANVAVDTSGEALEVAIGCGVDLIKPNLAELEEVLGRRLPDMASRVAAAAGLRNGGVSHVILSLGSEGALFLGPDGGCLAEAPPVEVVSTVGAGDAMLAGYLAGAVSGLDLKDRARLATVFAWCVLEDVERRAPTQELADERMKRIGVRSIEDLVG